MDTLMSLERLAGKALAIAEGATEELRARNSRQVKKAAASIQEAIDRQRSENAARDAEERAERDAREAAAVAEVEALAESLGLEVSVQKPAPKPTPRKRTPKPKPKPVEQTDVGSGVDVVDLTVVEVEHVPDPKMVRAWAEANGMEVKSRGVIPAHVRAAYNDAVAHGALAS